MMMLDEARSVSVVYCEDNSHGCGAMLHACAGGRPTRSRLIRCVGTCIGRIQIRNPECILIPVGPAEHNDITTHPTLNLNSNLNGYPSS